MSFVACNEQCRDAALHQTVRIREVTNMKSLNHWKSIVSLVVLTCLLAVPVSALGKKGKDHFNRGMKYEQAQQWEKAAQEFTLAMAADQVAIAIATLGGISERRIEQMTNPLTSLLPAFLTPEPGLNSGFMIAQVTAAALASENKALATPHSVDSISTSGNQEDYVSMGMSGARRLERMLRNLQNILAIELLCACQGIDLLVPLQTGTLAKQAYDAVRAKSVKVTGDRSLASDINAVSATIASGLFARLLH